MSWCADFEFRGTSGLSDADCAERRRGIPAGPERVVAVDAGEMHCLSLSPAHPDTQSSAVEKGESQDGENTARTNRAARPRSNLNDREQLGFTASHRGCCCRTRCSRSSRTTCRRPLTCRCFGTACRAANSQSCQPRRGAMCCCMNETQLHNLIGTCP